MDRQEANARLVELQEIIRSTISEAEKLANEHGLEFVISSNTLTQHKDEIVYAGQGEWLCSWEEPPGAYIGRWNASACW